MRNETHQLSIVDTGIHIGGEAAWRETQSSCLEIKLQPLMVRIFCESPTEWCVHDMSGKRNNGRRIDRTHQDIGRVTYTGRVYEGGLTSLTPERQFWRLPALTHLESN